MWLPAGGYEKFSIGLEYLEILYEYFEILGEYYAILSPFWDPNVYRGFRVVGC